MSVSEIVRVRERERERDRASGGQRDRGDAEREVDGVMVKGRVRGYLS